MASIQIKEGIPIRCNYHSHTPRCRHAAGSEESYVLSALKGGFSRLGFSDHSPWPYPAGFVSTVRMGLAELPGYAEAVRALEARFAGQIGISLGLEAEYYPEYARWLQETKEAHGIDFLIFGNHFDSWDENIYYGRISSPEQAAAYAAQAVAGIGSGLYQCLAHPDLFLMDYPRFDDTCRAASRDICQAARAMNLPLEYNVSGFYHKKHGLGFPNLDFWQIAAREGCSAVIGLDAHSPERLLDASLYDLARQHLRALGIPEITRLLPA